MNRKEMLENLFKGEKVTHESYKDGSYFFIKDGEIVSDTGADVCSDFPSEDTGYIIAEEPKKMVKWYRVTAHRKTAKRPCAHEFLCSSREEFLGANAGEMYHWIDLEFVCEKEQV